MAGRPPLPIGAHGKITTKEIRPKVWQAYCRVRDLDGVTRPAKRQGRSRSAAENNLRAHLTERMHVIGGELGPDSRLREAGELWFAQRETEIDGGDLESTTMEAYRSVYRNHVLPALGEVRLRELTVARCEAWQRTLRKGKGASRTKTARTVLGGILGYAARMGAIATNPASDLSRISGKAKRRPRALTATERADWLSGMEADAKAARWDIPDLTRFMLATGVRIGEALAVTWDDVELTAGTVDVAWKLRRVKGEGLVRVPGTKRGPDGGRLLRVPSWCVAMLRRRRLASGGAWPVFPDSLGGWRDPRNTMRVLRQCRDDAGFGWVTSHVFRKTCATVLDEAGLSAREIADVLEHADPSMTQRVYMGRGIASERAADALEGLA